jgi:hypothetical protein
LEGIRQGSVVVVAVDERKGSTMDEDCDGALRERLLDFGGGADAAGYDTFVAVFTEDAPSLTRL